MFIHLWDDKPIKLAIEISGKGLYCWDIEKKKHTSNTTVKINLNLNNNGL